MASLLKGYASYLSPITAPPTATTTNIRSLFDIDGKLFFYNNMWIYKAHRVSKQAESEAPEILISSDHFTENCIIIIIIIIIIIHLLRQKTAHIE